MRMPFWEIKQGRLYLEDDSLAKAILDATREFYGMPIKASNVSEIQYAVNRVLQEHHIPVKAYVTVTGHEITLNYREDGYGISD